MEILSFFRKKAETVPEETIQDESDLFRLIEKRPEVAEIIRTFLSDKKKVFEQATVFGRAADDLAVVDHRADLVITALKDLHIIVDKELIKSIDTID